MKPETAIIGGVWGDRRHLTWTVRDGEDLFTACSGIHYCPICNRELKEPYMSDTKAKIRAALEEHLGPEASTIRDDEDLRWRRIEWLTVTLALETEFDVVINDIVLEGCTHINQMARYIDTILQSKNASPN